MQRAHGHPCAHRLFPNANEGALPLCGKPSEREVLCTVSLNLATSPLTNSSALL
jgi:hypothetical protein